VSDRGSFGCEPDQGFDEKAGVGRGLTKSFQDWPLDTGDRPGGWLAHHLAEAVPAGGRGNVYHLPNTGGTQPKQHFGGAGIVLRDERDGGNPGKFADEAAQNFDLLRATAMDRNQYRVHRTLPNDAHRLRDGIPVNHGKAPTSGGIHPRPFHRQQDRSYGG
jgi:hypothetical protein